MTGARARVCTARRAAAERVTTSPNRASGARTSPSLPAFAAFAATRYVRLVRRLCQLCGAKLYAEDKECRQCGTPLGAEAEPLFESPAEEARASSTAVQWRDTAATDSHDTGDESYADSSVHRLPTEADLDAARPYAGHARTPTEPAIEGDLVDGVTPPSFRAPAVTLDDDAPPRRGLAIGIAIAVVAVAGIGGTAWWLNTRGPDDALATGPTEDAKAETMTPDTPTPTADAPPSATECQQLEALAGQWELTTEVVTSTNPAQLGIRGYFSLVVEVEGCAATAELTKLGYTGRWYADDKLQRGKAKLVPGPHFGFFGSFDLRDGNGRGGKQDVVLTVHEHRLAGTYRMPGRTGFLEGARDPGRKILPTLDDQPCIARCAVACDLLRRDTADSSARDALDRCNTTCSASEEPVCGDARPLPEEHLARMVGPADTLAAACSKVGAGCRTGVKIGKRPAPSVPPGKAWGGAELAVARGAVHVALRTGKGWFIAGPLLDLGGAELERVRMVSRDLGSGTDRHIVGELKTAERFATFTCRLEDDAPRCAMLPASAAIVSPLPSRALAVAGKSSPIEPAVYTW
jgi:hypothetical protein